MESKQMDPIRQKLDRENTSFLKKMVDGRGYLARRHIYRELRKREGINTLDARLRLYLGPLYARPDTEFRLIYGQLRRQ